MKILIAEDDGLEAQELARNVQALGHRVVGIAKAGRRTVEMAHSLEPDLILLDIAMPDLDGICAAREILAVRPVPIVIVTGHADPELVERAAATGVFTYLLKPIGPRVLDAAIQTAQARFAELQALRRQVSDLQEALEVRRMVEQAKGILMKRLQISEAEAFRRLQRRASAQRRPMKEIAEAVRETDRFYEEFDCGGKE
ncbi:MAG: response regulator [candidate division NC10 bacterium]|nr:response regulator [candidate division NC10 bacterium]